MASENTGGRKLPMNIKNVLLKTKVLLRALLGKISIWFFFAVFRVVWKNRDWNIDLWEDNDIPTGFKIVIGDYDEKGK